MTLSSQDDMILMFLRGLIKRPFAGEKITPIERDPNEEIVHVWICEGGSMKLYAVAIGPDEIDADAMAQCVW